MRFQLVRETDGIVHWDLPFERVGKYRSETNSQYIAFERLRKNIALER